MVDGHLQLPDDGVAALFDEDGEKLPVEVIKEELKVRATVPAATLPHCESLVFSELRDKMFSE